MKLVTFEDIALAAQQLPASERRKLLILLAQSLQGSSRPTPEPRDFSPSVIQGWIDEDERDFRDFLKRG